MKLQAALNLFLGEYIETTRRAYESALQPMVTALGPAREVNEIRPAEIVKYLQDMQSGDIRYITHPTRPNLKKPLSVATINKNIKSIKVFFNFLIKYKELTESPAANIRYKKTDTIVPRDKAASPEELDMILKAAFGNHRAFALISFIASTGCRAGGAAGLKIEDLFLDILTGVVTEKGNKTRKVWFDEETGSALRMWLKKRPSYEHTYVFGNKNGQVKSSSISQIIRRYAKKAGVRSLGAHSLRHLVGHKLSDAKVPPQLAKQVLGHENVETTIRHYYPHDEQRAEEAARLIHKSKPQIITLPRKSKSG